MAHTASVGSVKRTVNVPGKRLGIKKFGGEKVIPGDIILRQRGTKFYPGLNTGIGRDHTIFSRIEGFVSFRRMTGYKRSQKIVDVLVTKTIEKPIEKVEEKIEVAEKTVKKASKKTSKK